MIAFYGMGLLGSNFVRALRRRQEPVRVWSRTLEKAAVLKAEGAIVVSDPAEAARGAERLHLTLSDDAAVDEVLELVLPGLSEGAVIVDHTTTSPSGTRERAARWAERGIAFQHAPVFMGPQNALDATGIMLASGDAARFEALSPELSKMTGKLVYLGAEPERAAGFKLLGNAFLMFMTAGIGDVFTLARSLGIPATDAASLFRYFNPSVTLPARIDRILSADFANPSWTLAMARKDARLMIEAAGASAVALDVLPSIARVMDQWIERGHSRDDWTVIARRSRALARCLSFLPCCRTTSDCRLG
jgi:3-hydroxyisobutyrate dehydrogenase